MGLIDSVGDAFDAVGDAAGDSLGIVIDFAKSVNWVGVDENFEAYERWQNSVNDPRATRSQVLAAQRAYQKAHADSFSAKLAARRKAYFEDHKTIKKLAGGVEDTIGGSLEGLMWLASTMKRPFATGLMHDGPVNVPFFGAEDVKSPGIQEAWRLSKTTSTGQAAVVASGFAPEGANFQNAPRYGDKNSQKYNPWFSYTSGTIDAIMAWYVDPLVVGGKAIKVSREARSTMTAKDLAALERYRTSTRPPTSMEEEAAWLADPNTSLVAGRELDGTPVVDGYREAAIGKDFTRRQRKIIQEQDNLLDALEGRSAAEIMAMKGFRTSTMGATLAHLLSRAETREQKRLILAASAGSTDAMTQLMSQKAVIGNAMNRANEELDDMIFMNRLVDGGSVASINDTARMDQLRAEIGDLDEQYDLLHRATGDRDKLAESYEHRGLVTKDDLGIEFSTATQRLRVQRGDIAAMRGVSSYTVQDGALGLPVRVLGSPVRLRPTGRVNVHDADQGFRELDAMTKHVPNLDPETRVEMLNRFLKAPDDNARRLTLQHIEVELATKVARDLGYKDPDIMSLLSKMMDERDKVTAHFKESAYGFIDDGGAVVVADRPLMETQLANEVPLLDIQLIRRVLKRNLPRYKALKAGNEAWDLVVHGADLVNDLWKFSALFRGGYPVRNAIDSQLRMLMFLGASRTGRLQWENTRKQAAHFASVRSAKANLTVRQEQLTKLEAERARLWKESKDKNGPFSDFVFEDLDNQIAALRHQISDGPQGSPRFGQGEQLDDQGQVFPDVLGITNDEARFRVSEASASESHANIVRNEYEQRVNAMRGTGNWTTVKGSDPVYAQHYLRVVNQHFRQSEITRRLLAGEDPEDVILWLKSSKGRSIRRRMVFGSDTAEELVEHNLQNLNHVLPREFWAAASKRPLNEGDLTKMFREAGSRPLINAEQIAFSMGMHPLAREYGRVRDGYFRWVSKMTDDQLGRHPLYAELYRGQYKELVGRVDERFLGEARLRAIEEQSRLWARKEMRSILFDVSQKSDLSHFVRFVMPFYSAWQDAVTKYGRLMLHDPSRLVRAGELWTAPNDANFIEVVDTLTGKPVPGDKASLSDNEAVRLPEGIAKLFGLDYTLDISKSSLNIALQGDPIWLPGWGPMAQAPVNSWIKQKDDPDLAQIAQDFGILPFGVQDQGTLSWKSFLAGGIRWQQMPEQRKARMKAMIFQTELHRYYAGERKKPPTAEEVQNKYEGLRNLRILSNALSPYSIQFKSPYQFYIDQSHEFDRQIGTKYKDSLEADRAFYEQYGEDFYIFRASMSNNRTGIQASKKADAVGRANRKLIGKFPEYGWLFVGPNNDGEYDQNVYALQTFRRLNPLTKQVWRDTYEDPAEAFRKTNAEIGWMEYMKLTGRLEAIAESRGLSSMNVKEAADLRAIKADWLRKTTDPDTGPKWGRDWYHDYLDRDEGKIVKFLEAARAATQDKSLSKRQDIQVLGQYLEARRAFKKILTERAAAGGAKSISSNPNSANYDVWVAWDGYMKVLRERSFQFEDIYTRYLENDDLTAVE
jgi:hypothetical protein